MDARIMRWAVLAAAISSLGASYRTNNFIVSAPTQDAAEQIGRAAEKFRRELAVEWLGHTMPNWAQPCPITAQVGDQMGAGGATSFVFEHGEVFGWKMTIQGSLVRILDSVLPHEVTHTIFATHFRQPLPRWADEGACTTVEHASERAKQQTMLMDFLRTGRGIAFSRMFAMKDYPHDVMPLYSQGYSLARYLIAQKGNREFLDFVADGLKDENWTRSVDEHYGVASLASLQDKWLDWVKKGSPAIGPSKDAALVAVTMPGPSDKLAPSDAPRASRSHGDRSIGTGGDRAATALASAHADTPSVYELAAADKQRLSRQTPDAADEWRAPKGVASMQTSESDERPAGKNDDDRAMAGDRPSPIRHDQPLPAPVPYQVTRPQPMDRPRQVILEWSRPPEAASQPATPLAPRFEARGN